MYAPHYKMSSLLPSHFLDLHTLPPLLARQMVKAAMVRKKARTHGLPKGMADEDAPLAGRLLVVLLEQPSTRTRLSFQTAMAQMGGKALVVGSQETQMSRKETPEDTVRVLAGYADAVAVRAKNHETLMEMADANVCPVINALTNLSHPCQILADVMTLEEHLGSLEGKRLAWVGDGNNVATSWIHASALFGFELHIACPPAHAPPKEPLAWAEKQGAGVHITHTPQDAVSGADAVITDTWLSMDQSPSFLKARQKTFAPFCVNEDLMAKAKKGALFLHCLPAHRGEEVSCGVIEGSSSVVWEEAENRLHAQKIILLWCLEGRVS